MTHVDETSPTGAGRPRPWDPPRPERAPVDYGGEPTRLLDFVIGAFLLIPSSVPGLPDWVGIGLVTAALLCVVASNRRPRFTLGNIPWLPYAVALALCYTALVSVMGEDTSLSGWTRRFVRLCLVALVVFVVAGGRVHAPSLVRGAAVALVVNAGLFFAGVAPATYGRYLTGYLLDKNQAGFVYATVGVLAVGVVRARRWQLVAVAVFAELVWLTGSRTSMSAFAVAVIWLLARPRLGPPRRFALAGLLAGLLYFVENNYSQVGEFADRVGTDWFRARIDAASQVKLSAAPVQGTGLGDAYVFIDDRVFFFHNSYWGALVEAGWPWLLALVAIHVFVGMRPFAPGPPASILGLSAEAANLIVFVCALRLGEVFVTPTAAVVLGLSIVAHNQRAP